MQRMFEGADNFGPKLCRLEYFERDGFSYLLAMNDPQSVTTGVAKAYGPIPIA